MPHRAPARSARRAALALAALALVACGRRRREAPSAPAAVGPVIDAGAVQAIAPVPAGEPPAPRVARVAAGGAGACAIMTDTTVRCWGRARFGMTLAGGDPSATDVASTVPDLRDAVEVVLDDVHACARLADGTARCWGSRADGALGDGVASNDVATTPVVVPGLAGVVQLTAGGGATCARLADGTARCWGNNRYGRVGDIASRAITSPTIVARGVEEIALGGSHACALMADGSVRCWGLASQGQLGTGATFPAVQPNPRAVPGLTDVAQLALGANHACARRRDGTVRCWGANGAGQLGDGTTTDQSVPTAVRGLTRAVDVALGATHSCARTGEDRVVCWGAYGPARPSERLAPRDVPSVAGAAQIALGAGRTCVRTAEGDARCWDAGRVAPRGGDAARDEPVVAGIAF